MKYILSLFLMLILFQSSLYSQKLNENLIGEWEFFKLEDPNGNRIDALRNYYTYEIADAAYTIFNRDGSYSKQFTPENIDRGTWMYKKRKKEIHYKLIYEKPYGVAAKFLIEKGHAKKDENGDYYEVIVEKIIELNSQYLKIEERGNVLTYVKVK